MGNRRDFILSADDLPTVRVEAPEWGGPVFVRAMNAGEFSDYMAAVGKAQADGKTVECVHALVTALVARDEEGKRLFSDEDAAALRAKSGRVCAAVFSAAIRLNPLSPQEAVVLGKG